MTATDAERYVLMLYRAARAHCTPIQAIDCARNQVANELAFSFCNWPDEPFLHCVDQWRFADQCRTAIHKRAQDSTDTGLFWDTGVCTVKPRYWQYSIYSGSELHDTGQCPTLSCAVKHAIPSANHFDAEIIIFHTGERYPIAYRVSARQPGYDIMRSLIAQNAFA